MPVEDVFKIISTRLECKKMAEDQVAWEYVENCNKNLIPASYSYQFVNYQNEYFKEICDEYINCSIDEKVALLKDMGCVAMSVGIESGNEELRTIQLGRKMSNEQIINAIQIMNNHGIRVSTFNMVGLPGETRENVFETIELNRRLKVSSCNCYIVYPYPGTPIAIKYKTSYRNNNQEFIDIDEASKFHLSKMEPKEVEGLHKTFNLYLHLPKELWPIIELAENDGVEAKKYYIL